MNENQREQNQNKRRILELQVQEIERKIDNLNIQKKALLTKIGKIDNYINQPVKEKKGLFDRTKKPVYPTISEDCRVNDLIGIPDFDPIK